ncbi:MAG TPA: penicillin-binding protein [Terriglobales bacterium]
MAASTARNNTNLRLYLLGGIFLFWCCVICIRLVYLQIFCYGEFEQRAQHQQQRTVEVAARRGVIYDRAGRELAMSIAVDSVFAVPTEIPDLPNTISLIARITREDPREILAKCEASKSFCWIKRKADAEMADRIRSLNLRGIHFQKESKRFYPKRELAAQVLGYVGMDDEGLSGIEREYNDELQGKPGRMLISVDARRQWFGSVEKQPEPGQNIVLTIDQQIQYIAEQALDAAMEKTHALSGTVIVENPHTGEILALANSPTFNPNVSRAIKPQNLKDHAVSDIYEPGSTFKLVTIAAALDQKLTTPNEIFDCQMGSIVIDGVRIHDSEPHGLLPVSGILAESSDVGSIKIALRLGDQRFYQYIRAFGFGDPTGIELPHETRGLLRPVNRWSRVSLASTSMGQGIGISAIQLSALISTIADDGVHVMPHIVMNTNAPQSPVQTVAFHPTDERRVVSPFTAAEMKQMMQGVILHGTGRKAVLEGYTAAGKTGTAQKIDPETKAYSHTKYWGSFAGFAPVNNPAIVVAVIFDSAQGPHQGGQIAAPVFQSIAQQTLEYLHVPHDVELPQSRQLLLAEKRVKDKDLEEGSPDHLGDSVEVADANTSDTLQSKPAGEIHPAATAAQASNDNLVPASLTQRESWPEMQSASPSASKTSGKESAAQQSSAKPAPIDSSATVVLDVAEGGIVVPSFIGKSVRSSIEVAEGSGLDLDAEGSGVARDQAPVAGSRVAAGSRIVVRFGR